jgi:hypothetical protein
MKALSTLALGALLIGGAAVAATTLSAPTATPAPAVHPAVKRASAMRCEKLAKAKNLSGDDEKKFVEHCRESKKGSDPIS